jgi:hypothetical protein
LHFSLCARQVSERALRLLVTLHTRLGFAVRARINEKCD